MKKGKHKKNCQCELCRALRVVKAHQNGMCQCGKCAWAQKVVIEASKAEGENVSMGTVCGTCKHWHSPMNGKCYTTGCKCTDDQFDDELYGSAGYLGDLGEVNREALKQTGGEVGKGKYETTDWGDSRGATKSGSLISSVTSYKTCVHNGERTLFEIKRLEGDERAAVRVHAARVYEVNAYGTDLIIDCADSVSLSKAESFVKRGPKLLQEALAGAQLKRADVLALNWPDQGSPIVGLAWWVKLVEMLRMGEWQDVTVCCVGSHGRTGTALASIMSVLWPQMGAKEAVKWVRKEHCKEAVESKAQVKYLEWLWEQAQEWAGVEEEKKA